MEVDQSVGTRNTRHSSKVIPNPRRNRRKTPVVSKAAEAFRRLIADAEYELLICPYRGMSLPFEDMKHSPWWQCAFGSHVDSQDEDSTDTITSPDESDNVMGCIQATFECSCPTLVAYANDHEQKQRRRKMENRIPFSTGLMERCNRDPESICGCDFNPFCLCALGGSMTEVLCEKIKHLELDTDKEVAIVETNESKLTPEILALKGQLRRDAIVSRKDVLEYLRARQKYNDSLDCETCLENIESDEGRVVFHENMLSPRRVRDDRMLVSIPPGIENLGATCYLNTQLQCLVQNVVFVAGILSWTPAVGRENDKMSEVLNLFQQLLARMKYGSQAVVNTVEFANALGLDQDEQQDPNEFSRLFLDKIHEVVQEKGGSEDSDLTNLLPNLFRGQLRYETMCLQCMNVSVRRENFMDLNIPIVKRTGASGQTTIEESFARKKKKSDTDLQYCFDTCYVPESLEGDNLYFCENCQRKQRAIRDTFMEKLPPVLNIQLSRYVFDMETLTKRKISEKVRLPRCLVIKESKQGGSDELEHNFILAAVMRHQGQSAYSGHYIGEAMDWRTGIWFEFNDNIVKKLDKGPSSSFHPSEIDEDTAGSDDAYNMYFVREDYLSQLLVTESASPDLGKIEAKMLEDTCSTYHTISGKCLNDREKWDVANTKKTCLKTQVLSNVFDPQLLSGKCVWTDTGTLRACFSGENVAPRLNLSCPHGKHSISPDQARRGKVLPQDLLDKIVDICCPESKSTIVGVDISNMTCDACVQDFKDQMEVTLCRAKAVARLHECLDPSKDHFGLHFDVVEDEAQTDSRFAYALCRKFVTLFRSRVSATMKKIPGFESKASVLDKPWLLESADLSNLGGDISDDENRVNDLITCQHDKCRTTSKKSVRFVPLQVWKDIKFLFPKATELKIKRVTLSLSGEINSSCPICREERQISETARIELLAALNKSYDFDPKTSMADSLGGSCRLVYNEDIVRWKKFASMGKRKGNTKTIVELFETVFPKTVVKGLTCLKAASGEISVDESLPCAFVPLRCSDHGLPIRSAVFDPIQSENSASEVPHKLLPNVSMLKEDAYNELRALVETTCRTIEFMRCPSLKRTSTQASISHPTFRPWNGVGGVESKPQLFCVESDQSQNTYQLESAVCEDPRCAAAFASWRASRQTSTSAIPKRTCTSPVATGSITIVEDDDLLKLKVLEIEPNASDESIFSSLNDFFQRPITTGNKESADGVRRSSRKRKHLSCGVILSDTEIEVETSDNVAAIRLLLLQECHPAFQISDSLCALIPRSVAQGTSPAPFSGDNYTKIDMSVASRETLESLFGFSSETDKEISQSVVLLREKLESASVDSEGLMDRLLQESSRMGNSSPASRTSPRKRKTRKIAERGFTGTLLVGGASSSDGPDQAAFDEGESRLPNIVEEDDFDQKPLAREPADRSEGHEASKKGAISDLSGLGDGDVCVIESEATPDPPWTKSSDSQPKMKAHMVLEELFKCPGVKKIRHEGECNEAVTFAMKHNCSDRVVVDVAFAKYTELVLNTENQIVID